MLDDLLEALHPTERAAAEPIFRIDRAKLDATRSYVRLGPKADLNCKLVSLRDAHCPLQFAFARLSSSSTFYSWLGDPSAEFHDSEPLDRATSAWLAEQLADFLESAVARVERWSRGRLLTVRYRPDRVRIDGEPAEFGTREGWGLPFAPVTIVQRQYEPWLPT